MNDNPIKKLESLVSEYKRIMQGQVNLEKLTYYAVTYHSTAIEGSTLTEGQVYNLPKAMLLYDKSYPAGPGKVVSLQYNTP